MPRDYVLAEPDQLIRNVYFIESGVASMVTISPEGLAAEAGMVGPEGMLSTVPILGGDTSPNRISMQLAGSGWRLDRGLFAEALARSPTLRDLMGRFLQTLIVQASYTALSNAVHQIDERLARWLLMCDDRIDSGEMSLTHDFLSLMLSVRRPSVTTALHVLEGNGFIRAERGCVTMRNRAEMEQFASDCYGMPEAAYRRLIGPVKPSLR